MIRDKFQNDLLGVVQFDSEPDGKGLFSWPPPELLWAISFCRTSRIFNWRLVLFGKMSL